MTFAQESIQRLLIYYAASFVLIMLGIVVSFFGKKSNKIYPFGFALLFTLVLHINSFIPFAKDINNKSMIVTQCYYENKIGGRKSSHSDNMGIYSITLETTDGIIHLSTVPGNKDAFVLGRHYVTAYYLPESKFLLHIEPRGQEGHGDKGSVCVNPNEK